MWIIIVLSLFLESFTGEHLDENVRNRSFVCHDCLLSFEKFDDLQNQANDIQKKMVIAYRRTSDIEQIFVKQEPENESGTDEPEPTRMRKLHKTSDLSYCKTCSKQFKSPVGLDMHLAMDHERHSGPFDCPKCSKGCKDGVSFRTHYLTHVTQRSLLCVRCGATFAQMKCLQSHMQIHDDIRPFSCTIANCSKKFLDGYKLKWWDWSFYQPM